MKKIAARVALDLIVSIVIPTLAGVVHDRHGHPYLSVFDQIVLGGIVFLAIGLARLERDLADMLRLRLECHQLLQVQYETDLSLLSIQTSIHRLLSLRPYDQNLFAQYFTRYIRTIAAEVKEAADRGTIRLDELTFGTTDVLFDVVEHHPGCDLLRLVHTLDERPNNFDFSVWAKNYYTRLTRLAAAKQVRIQRLFIYTDESDLEDPLAMKLFQFHLNKGYDRPKILHRTDWTVLTKSLQGTVLKSYRDGIGRAEFGVWGDLLAYVAVQSATDRMLGYYTYERSDIEPLAEAFDAAYRLAQVAPITNITPISVEQLFDTGFRVEKGGLL